MHEIEPHYNWRDLYIASSDRHSPFHGKVNSDIEFTDVIYDHYIHPQWDNMGSATLYMKLLYANYEEGYCIIELFGEWNDTLYNDIMFLKRNIADNLIDQGINKFILIGENILNFHSAEDDYYQEWFEDIEDGWIACVNFRDHIISEFESAHIDYYVAIGGTLNNVVWRSLNPMQVCHKINSLIVRRLIP